MGAGETLKGPVMPIIHFLRTTSKDLGLQQHREEQVESICDTEPGSGDTEFSLASATKQHWDIGASPSTSPGLHFLWVVAV